MDAGWAAVVAAGVTGATAVLTIVLTQRHERRRVDAERQDRHLLALLEPRLRAYENVMRFLVALTRKYVRFAQPGNEREWGPLCDAEEARAVLTANQLWLARPVVTAFEEVFSQLCLGASMALSLHGTKDLENAIEGMAESIVSTIGECETAVRSALCLPALDSIYEHLGKQQNPVD